MLLAAQILKTVQAFLLLTNCFTLFVKDNVLHRTRLFVNNKVLHWTRSISPANTLTETKEEPSLIKKKKPNFLLKLYI